MIIVNTLRTAVSSFIYEGLRRLWSVSVNENNELVNLDYEYNHCEIINKQHQMKFDDVFIPEDKYNKVVNELVNEPYCVQCGTRKYYLKERDKAVVKMNIAMGPSPWSCERTFAERHPKYKVKNEGISW